MIPYKTNGSIFYVDDFYAEITADLTTRSRNVKTRDLTTWTTRTPLRQVNKIGLSTGVPKEKVASTPLVLRKSNTLVKNPVSSYE